MRIDTFDSRYVGLFGNILMFLLRRWWARRLSVMGRSQSPVPRRREDKRDDKRDRERDRDRRRPRSRDRVERVRSRSRERPDRRRRSGDRRRNRSRSESEERAAGGSKPPPRQAVHERPAITQADLEGKSPEEQDMIRMMGFGGFDSTKGKKVENNDVGEVQVVLKRKYRQYMNRKGGFNRPLDFVAWYIVMFSSVIYSYPTTFVLWCSQFWYSTVLFQAWNGMEKIPESSTLKLLLPLSNFHEFTWLYHAFFVIVLYVQGIKETFICELPMLFLLLPDYVILNSSPRR